ncbi:hypothetical protein [Hafnia paralvei]|uniref:hypothetical protein n=1 Tax=Hafnia paralvei TaxID=546367 RepID=UPI003C586918
MAILIDIKKMLSLSKSTNKNGFKYTMQLAMTESNYSFSKTCSENNIIEAIYVFYICEKKYERNFLAWDELPPKLTDGSSVDTFYVVMDISILRMNGIFIYADEHELVRLRQSPPSEYLVIALSLNQGKCTICPTEYNKNEILRYSQVKIIWDLLSSCSDDQRGGELVFLYKQKVRIELNYSYDDLSFEFDGLAKLEKIFSDGLHEEGKRNIMQNTLYSLLRNESPTQRFKKILRDFTLFSLSFEESYRAFSVGFSFDKIRKEYTERFREYLSKLNSIFYDSLTRSLSIPVSGIISFSVMKSDTSPSVILINLASLLLAAFASVSIFYLSKFQTELVKVTQLEYKELFKSIKDELKTAELKELDSKEASLDTQAKVISRTLKFIESIAISNIIINTGMFIIMTFS